MRLIAAPEEIYCLKSKTHADYCTGTRHICYRCGFLKGPCHHRTLGTLLDY